MKRLVSGYLGERAVFDRAITAFAVAYADQREKDHEAVTKAVQAGRVEAVIEKEI